MNTLNESLFLPVADAHMFVHIVRPDEQGVFPAIILGTEIFGLTTYIVRLANRLAEQGFVVIVPNFSYRKVTQVNLSYDQGGREQGLALFQQLQRDDVLQAIAAIMHYVSVVPTCNQRIGLLGLSSGGHIAYLASAHFSFEVTVIFYAGWLTDTKLPISQPTPTLAFAPQIAAHGGKLIYFVGECDALIPIAEQQLIAQTLTAAQVSHELIVYPNVAHGFFCEDRDSYDIKASTDAWTRTCHHLSVLHTAR